MLLLQSFLGPTLLAAEGQLVGVQGEVAVVQTEDMMEAAEDARQDPRLSNGGMDDLTADVPDAYFDTAVIAAESMDGANRLLMMVKSDSFRQIVDPVYDSPVHSSDLPERGRQRWRDILAASREVFRLAGHA